MSLLHRIVQYFLQKKSRDEETRVFLQDEELIAVIKNVAKEQKRGEEEIVAEFTKAGLN